MAESPSQTLYVHNLNEKIKKDVLKKMLYMVFSQYGKVDEIRVTKGAKLRGQAWVIFRDVNSAASALAGKQGFNFYDKPLKLAFAKAKSHAVAKKEGTFVAPASNKRPREEDADENELATAKDFKLEA